MAGGFADRPGETDAIAPGVAAVDGALGDDVDGAACGDATLVDPVLHDSGIDDPDDDTDDFLAPPSRRRFLALMAGAAGATFISPAELAAAAERGLSGEIGPAAGDPNAPQAFTFSFTRPTDLIDLKFTLYNLQVSGSPQKLVKQVGGRPAYIVVEFPPQHVAEEGLHFTDPDATTYPDGSPAAPKPGVPYSTGSGLGKRWHRALPLRSRIASPSRIAFEVDPSEADIPLTDSGLLNWTSPAFSPALVAEANTGRVWSFNFGAGYFVKPLAEPRKSALYSANGDKAPETAIEFPYGLVLTPTSFGRWLHSLTPVTRNGRTEVWSTALRNQNLRFIDFDAQQIGRSGLNYASWSNYSDADLRAVWTTQPEYAVPGPANSDPPQASPDPGFVNLPTPRDRWQLVSQTTYMPTAFSPRPPALRAKRFRMSSIGATVDMSGDFDSHPSDGLTLINYIHRAFAGRDFYVKVVKEGYLYPTLHLAAKVTVAERVFIAPTGIGASTGPVAYLQTYTFIVVKQKHRTFGGDSRYGRRYPFTSVTIDTETSPPIAQTPLGAPVAAADDAFFPTVAGSIFRWACTVTDQVGQTHQVKIPFAFVDSAYVETSTSNRTKVATAYNNFGQGDFRMIITDGLRVGFAPDGIEGTKGKTSFPTFGISFRGNLDIAGDAGLLSDLIGEDLSFPAMNFAAIKLDGLSDFAGAGGVFGFQFPDLYLDSGFGGNNEVGKVFARMLDLGGLGPLSLPGLGSLGITFSDLSQIGGLISPNFDLTGLSAALGTFGGEWPSLAGLPDLLGIGGNLQFDPSAWFSSFPKILGGIDLADILQVLGGGGPGSLPSLPSIDVEAPEIPGLTTELIKKDIEVLGKVQSIPIGMTIKYRWSTTNLRNSPLDIFEASFSDGGPNSELIISAEATVKYDVDASEFASPSLANLEAKAEAQAELKNFRVNLIGKDAFGFITLQFTSLSFSAKTGSSPKVVPNLANVEFKGALEYIMELRKYFAPEGGLFNNLPSASSGDIVPMEEGGLQFTPIFDVTSSKVAVGFTLGLPTLAVGVFSLSNMQVGMLVTLPFNSDPMTARFNVSSKDSPFLLTVGIFGGGGFFLIELGLNGIRSLEISLEFGAAAQFDIGIASGSVSVMAGIYFAMRTDPDEQLELSGFVRLNGRVEVLCIITISVEFLLTLSYVKPPGVAKGRAELTVTIEIAFFSKDVSMSVEKEFGGNSTGAAYGKAGALAAAPGGPVRYADLMSESNYEQYVGAFA